METLRNNATAIVVELESLGFGPGDTDKAECRVFHRRNTGGHAALRVCVVFGDENTVNNISVHGFDGSAGEIIDWHMEITGGITTNRMTPHDRQPPKCPGSAVHHRAGTLGTAIYRSERFCDGGWEIYLSDEVLARVIERARHLITGG